MSDIIYVTLTDEIDVIDVTLLDPTETIAVTLVDDVNEISVAVTDFTTDSILVSVQTDPLDEILVTLTDGVSDQDLDAKMEAWHWPKSVVLAYLPGGELDTVTKETGEVLQLNRTSGTLTSIGSTKGWTKTLVYTGDQLTSVTVS